MYASDRDVDDDSFPLPNRPSGEDLKMYLIKHIVTQDIQLEGVYSQALIGPTPRNLVDPDVAATTTANRME
jgi:hypothetical protein